MSPKLGEQRDYSANDYQRWNVLSGFFLFFSSYILVEVVVVGRIIPVANSLRYVPHVTHLYHLFFPVSQESRKAYLVSR